MRRPTGNERLQIIIIISIALALTGCASTVSQQEATAAHFDPLPTDYQTAIKGFNAGRLKDPYSAVYRFGQPHRGFWQDGLAYGGRKHFGVIVPVAINARNSFGGYTGDEMHYYAFNGGIISEVTSLWNGPPKMAGFL